MAILLDTNILLRISRENTSQIVFAAWLNGSPSLVSKWEQGEKHPQGASLKLLTLVEKKRLEIVE